MSLYAVVAAALERARGALAPVTLQSGRPSRSLWIWFGLALASGVALAGLVLAKMSAEPYLIADDARQQIFWMQRFEDRALFPNDIIADYFESVSPQGLSWLYRGAAVVGVPPLTFGKILPAIAIVLTVAVTFWTCFELCAVPAAGFAAALLLEQSVGFASNVASGTAKGFVYLLTLLFLYGWLRRSRGLCWLAILLQGLFYPQAVLVCACFLVLSLAVRARGRWGPNPSRRERQLAYGGLAIAAAVLAPYALASSAFGPTISAAQALEMPEFFRGGRARFFRSDLVSFLLYGRSGLRFDAVLTPATNLIALALPAMLGCPRWLPLAKSVRAGMGASLVRLAIAALCCFVAAHAFLFRLHLPSRYTGHYFRMVFVLAAGIAIVVAIDALLRQAILALERRSPVRVLPSAGAALVLVAVLLLYPLTIKDFPILPLHVGREPLLYEFFASQPKTSAIASLTAAASDIPSFAGRSVLASPEVAIPYHVGYYRLVRERIAATIAAQYTSDTALVRAFIRRYGVTHWLLSSEAFEAAALQNNDWLEQYQPETDRAGFALRSGRVPVLAELSDRCAVFASERYRVLEARCILRETSLGPLPAKWRAIGPASATESRNNTNSAN